MKYVMKVVVPWICVTGVTVWVSTFIYDLWCGYLRAALKAAWDTEEAELVLYILYVNSSLTTDTFIHLTWQNNYDILTTLQATRSQHAAASYLLILFSSLNDYHLGLIWLHGVSRWLDSALMLMYQNH